MFSFAWWPVFLLLPLPFFVYYTFRPVQQREAAALRVPFWQALQSLPEQKLIHTNHLHWKKILLLLSWILLVTAAARPQWVGSPQPLTQSGRDLIMAIDLSGSMTETDFVYQQVPINRLVAVKVVAQEFIEKRKLDRVGLILFGTKAYVQAPLTHDHDTLVILMNEAQIGMAGDSTAIGDAIGLTMKQLRNRPEEGRVLILLTDGANTDGKLDPIKAAKLSADIGLKIYTIGIGADEALRQTLFGSIRVNPSRALDEKTLTSIAEITGGEYFRARDVNELSQIYALIDELEPNPEEAITIRPYKDYYYWPLALSFIGFLLGSSTIQFKHPKNQLSESLNARKTNNKENENEGETL